MATDGINTALPRFSVSIEGPSTFSLSRGYYPLTATLHYHAAAPSEIITFNKFGTPIHQLASFVGRYVFYCTDRGREGEPAEVYPRDFELADIPMPVSAENEFATVSSPPGLHRIQQELHLPAENYDLLIGCQYRLCLPTGYAFKDIKLTLASTDVSDFDQGDHVSRIKNLISTLYLKPPSSMLPSITRMHLYSHTTTCVLLLCGLSDALPGILVKRDFAINDDECPRSQDEKNLIVTEFGIAQDMAQAVAASGLTSSNKWAKYFFDDETIKDPDQITSYYGKLRDLYDDPSYKVAITCPTKKEDADWDVCGTGVWASTQSAGNKRITLCPIFFDGYQNHEKQDSSIVTSNCKPGAKGESNWKIIEQFKGIKGDLSIAWGPYLLITDVDIAFTILHESSHLKYATDSDNVPPSKSNQSHDYAYDRPACKKLRDGGYANLDLCASYPRNICPAQKSFRNADSIAFVAAGIYWEDKCGKTIDAEAQSGDPIEVTDPGSDTEDPDGDGGGTTTSTASSANVTPPPPIGPLTSCSLVQYVPTQLSASLPNPTTDTMFLPRTTLTGTIAGGPQTYCTCGSVIAGINTETSGSLVYSVCAGDPYPTVATSTIEAPPPAQTLTVDLGPCSDGMFGESTCNGACGPGTCESGSTALGQRYFYCDCP
ncbi:MAG: hypothetical protein Q9184_003471 [Pyrenodesmia sp. 2 TL-2023]